MLDLALRDALRALPIGARVAYKDWRGDNGEGVVVRFVSANGTPIKPGLWGIRPLDGIVIKRDFSADDGRIFRPLLGDGDILTLV
jgi:hypothetical protein